MLISLWGHLSYFLKDFYPYLLAIILFLLGTPLLAFKINKSALSKNKKKILTIFLFTLFSFVIVFSIFEAYFRYKFDTSDSLGFLNVTTKWYSRHVVYNNFQYRDKDFTLAKTPGKVRIGVMGDSVAFGYGIKDVNNRFSNLLENKLNNNGYNVEVYNFAVPGLDTEGELREYQRVKKLKFDILVWSYFMNDIEEATRSAGESVLKNAQSSSSLRPGLIKFLSDNSYFFNYVYWRLNARYNSTFANIQGADLSQYNIPEIYNHHQDIIGSFIKNNSSMKIVTIVFPFLSYFPNYPKEAIVIHQKVDNMFLEKGAASVIDLLPYLKGKNENQLIVSKFDSHPNEFVHEMAAEKLYNSISNLLEKKGKETFVK